MTARGTSSHYGSAVPPASTVKSLTEAQVLDEHRRVYHNLHRPHSLRGVLLSPGYGELSDSPRNGVPVIHTLITRGAENGDWSPRELVGRG